MKIYSTFMNNMKKRLDREDKREQGIFKAWHSHFYHSYFEGYTEYKRKDSKGKMRLERVYTGKYYIQNLEKWKSLLVRIIYCIFYVIAIAAFLCATTLPSPVNFCVYVNAITAVVCIIMFVNILALINYLTCGHKMKIREYKSGPDKIKKMAKIGIIANVISMVAAIVYIIFIHTFDVEDIKLLCYHLISIISIFAVFFIESKIEYFTEENENEPEHDGIEIS
jgi:hypothetical protein